MPRFLAAVLAMWVMASAARAQPAADRVPGEAMVYFGWRGSQDLGPGYPSSHAKALLDASKLPAVVNEVIPKLISRFAQKDPRSFAEFKKLDLLLPAAMKYPTAFFIEDIDLSDPDHPLPKLGLVCKAGPDAAALGAQVADLLARAPKNADVPVRSSVDGDTVSLLIGYDAGTGAVAGKALIGNADFKAAVAEVGEESALILFIDAERIISKIETVVNAKADAQKGPFILGAIDVAGFHAVKQIALSAGFDGRDWVNRGFVGVPSPRVGLATLLDVKPVSADLLKAIPASATYAQTIKLDPARFITTVRDIVGQLSPEAQSNMDKGLGAVQLAVGKNLVTDILEPLGEDWAVYQSPEVNGLGLTGTVVINKLDDVAKAKQALPMLSIFVGNMMAAYARNDTVALTAKMTKIDDLSVYYVATPLVTPSWTISNGYLYLGLQPQAVATAARWTNGGGKSIADSEKFAALQKRLGVENPTSVSFNDDPIDFTYGGGYQTLSLLANIATAADLFGVTTPQPLLPPMDVFLQHLAPSGGAMWVDDKGLHGKSVQSFPLSNISGSGAGMALLSSYGSAIPVLLPSLNRARETANRVKSASNLRSIGLATMMYSNDNKGRLPAKLSDLPKGNYLGAGSGVAAVFINPRSGNALPSDFASMSAEEQGTWIDERGDYVYVRSSDDRIQRIQRPGTAILAFERPGTVTDGVNIVFVDGHVEFFPVEKARQMVIEQGFKW